MRVLIVLMSIASCVLPISIARSASVESQVTSLDLRKCLVTHIAKETDDGTPLKHKDWRADTWRCNGPDGWHVFVTEGDSRPVVAFSRAAMFDGPWQSFSKFGSTGVRVEWRGPVVKGEFKPTAAILRFDWAYDSYKGSVLAVARLDREQSKTCIFAYVDTNANKNADELADDQADTKVADTSCPANYTPAYIGQISEGLK